ncbi:MAG: GyrI-like domain-containing protein [Anaerolineaceae bacterium]|nr:GyrI-like domain-containing protein [Anaerolineaceae bacterium]
MEPKIIDLSSKILVGMHVSMSLADNKTGDLWRAFMPRRREVVNRVDENFISMQVYQKGEQNHFLPTTVFDKWAVVEVSDADEIPEGMETYVMQGGKYAMFVHHGSANEFPKTMQSIFGEWMPRSDYQLDDREQFEVLAENYDPIDVNAREEVWIPIREK